MKSLPLLAALAFIVAVPAIAGDGIIDLTKLANYAAQPVPAYLTPGRTNTGANTITDLGATLGRVLFYDKRLSRNDTISCASCHQQARAFGDTPAASTGVAGTTGRHSMRLINSRFANEVRFFWDERAASLENQTTQPIQDHVEMGFSNTLGDPAFADLVTKLSAIDEYRVLFAATFGTTAITEARVQLALAQFVRSIQSFDSKFDTGRAQVANNGQSFPNFTAQENAGKQLFLQPPPQGGAGCGVCHRAPEFDIDPASRNNGVIGRIGGGTDLTNTRSPSLRDLLGPAGQTNGAFMHDASLTTLNSVIDHYNQIPVINTPANNNNLDNRLRPAGQLQNLNLTQGQKDSLVAFLRTLTGTAVYTDARWADPFDANGQLSLVILPSETVAIENHGNGTATVSSQGAKGLTYQVQSSSNLQGWTTVTNVTADATGRVAQLVPLSGTAFYRFIYQLP